MKLPAKPDHSQCRAVIDSREQLPYALDPLTVESGTLSTGDYGLAGEFSGLVCVERKSLGDFLSSCTTGRERFDRELQRMQAFPSRAIVVEASWSDIEAGEWRAKATPAGKGDTGGHQGVNHIICQPWHTCDALRQS